jgi:hypothetical protein
MTGSLMVQAYRATGDTSYLNFFADYLLNHTCKLQQFNDFYWHNLQGSKLTNVAAGF